ncbi:MAG: GNAT family N-acetyltransferase [Candidatus Aminicenantes bacterium]|nr:GNAT family N-acetyltransferase [Candidatus Aminicenantes bacterium]
MKVKSLNRINSMDKKIIIREYKKKDLKQVLKLVKELETELENKFTDVKLKSGVDDYKNRYLKPENKYRTFVAVVDDKIVGFLMGYPSLGAPEVDNMYDVLPVLSDWTTPEFYLQITFVSKPYRNQGISTKLHEKVIDYAREKGHKEVYACIAKWNLPEIKVIESVQFQKKDLGYRYRLSLKL